MPRRSKQSSGDIFPLLRLPAELRNAIYEATLITPSEINATFDTPPLYKSPVTGVLLRTCRQVYSEAHALLYTHNTFRVGDEILHATSGIIWLSKIGTKNQKLLRKVIIDIQDLSTRADAFPFLNFLSELRRNVSGLRELQIWISETKRGHTKGHTLLANELIKFGDLERLVIGGGFDEWWFASFRWVCADRNTKIEMMAKDSSEWAARKAQKSRQRELLRRSRLESTIQYWQEGRERELNEMRCLGTTLWRSTCPCAECAASQTSRQLPSSDGGGLSRAAEADLAKWERGCECNDCNWVRKHGTSEQKAMNCVEVHELASNGGIDGTWPLQSFVTPYPNAQATGEPERHHEGYDTKAKVKTLPIRRPEERNMQGSDNLRHKDDGLEREASGAETGALSGKSSLRHKHRKWYGQPPC